MSTNILYKEESYNIIGAAMVDFICYNNIILEIKAVSSIAKEHKAQTINYLKATNINLGIIINFGENNLVHERMIRVN